MPGRTARAPRASTARKVSAATTSRASPAPAEPVDTPDNALRSQVCAVFKDAQRTTATHRKLVTTLRKIQESCCYEPSQPKKSNAIDDYDEEAFNHEFVRCVLKVMPVKKTENVGDKTIRFIGLFLRHANERDAELMPDPDAEEDFLIETPSTRLTTQVLGTVLDLTTAKDKFVRFRSTQLISHAVSSLNAIDDDVFQHIQVALVKRIRDKEAMVRSQAVLGLCRISMNLPDAGMDSDNSDVDEQKGLRQRLLEVLQHDPSADVRRTAAATLDVSFDNIHALLERARDEDVLTRRMVYSKLLPKLGDFRHLKLAARERLLRHGLRDRDEHVRKATCRLFQHFWIENCAGFSSELGTQDPSPPNFEALLELLERIDVVNTGIDNGVAHEAMDVFWEGRPDYRNAMDFNEEFWNELTAESVFVVRSFNDFCKKEGNAKYSNQLEDKLPTVSTVAYYLERQIATLIKTLKENMENPPQEEEETVENEFIVEQLLHMALTLDYSDDYGRRKMFTLLRSALSIAELPEEITKLAVMNLRYICSPDAAGEREFCSVVLESVADVHDTIVDDPPPEDAEESFHSARSEVSREPTPAGGSKRSERSEDNDGAQKIKEIIVNLKCLHIVECMLKHVAGNLKDNPDLVSTLNNLVVPAVRSHESPIRERGLVCLGLCALLDRDLAEENLALFIHFFNKGHTALQITALEILTDLLNSHGAQLINTTPALMKVYIKATKSGSKAAEVQAAAVVAASKLLLGRVITDEEASQELLKSLVVAHFDPSTKRNQTVRQAMNYFLPVFCYSRPQNQDLMRIIALDALHALYLLREGLDDDDEIDVDEDMVSLSTIGATLVDWTDPRKCYNPNVPLEPEKKVVVNGDIHLDFCGDILDKLDSNVSKDEKKLVASLLGKLYISPGSSEEKLREYYSEISQAVEDNIVTDATSKNALYKIHVSLGKIVNALDEQQEKASQTIVGRSTRSVSTTLPPGEGKTASAESTMVKVEEEDEEEDVTVVAHRKIRSDSVATDDTRTLDGESEVEGEAADEEGDTVMGDA